MSPLASAVVDRWVFRRRCSACHPDPRHWSTIPIHSIAGLSQSTPHVHSARTQRVRDESRTFYVPSGVLGPARPYGRLGVHIDSSSVDLGAIRARRPGRPQWPRCRILDRPAIHSARRRLKVAAPCYGGETDISSSTDSSIESNGDQCRESTGKKIRRARTTQLPCPI